MPWVSIVGITAGVLTSTSLLPQLIKVVKTKEVEDLSYWTLLVLVSGLSLWVVYGILKVDWPIIATNAFAVLLNLTLIFYRFRYGKKALKEDL